MRFEFESRVSAPWWTDFVEQYTDHEEEPTKDLTALQKDKRRQDQRKDVAPESGFLIVVERASRNRFNCKTTNGRNVGGVECLDPVLSEMLFPGITVIARHGRIDRQDRYIRSRSPSSFGDGTPIQV